MVAPCLRPEVAEAHRDPAPRGVTSAPRRPGAPHHDPRECRSHVREHVELRATRARSGRLAEAASALLERLLIVRLRDRHPTGLCPITPNEIVASRATQSSCVRQRVRRHSFRTTSRSRVTMGVVSASREKRKRLGYRVHARVGRARAAGPLARSASHWPRSRSCSPQSECLVALLACRRTLLRSRDCWPQGQLETSLPRID